LDHKELQEQMVPQVRLALKALLEMMVQQEQLVLKAQSA
jgi:hypothetical protein